MPGGKIRKAAFSYVFLNGSFKSVYMKFSIYNSAVSLTKDSFLLYNSFTDSYIIVLRNLYESIAGLPPEGIREKSPALYRQMVDSGYLVGAQVDEVSMLKNRIERTDGQAGEYFLTINPTMNCNFRCWYCYEKHLSRSKMAPEVVESVKKHIASIFRKSENLHVFHLGFFGGEPLLYYAEAVRPLLLHIKELCSRYEVRSSIGFTSNGYLLTGPMIEEMKSYGVHSFQITLDGGKEFHERVRYPYKGAGSYDKILSNIKKLLRAGIYVVMRINYTQANLASVASVADDLNDLSGNDKQFLSVDFHQVWQDQESNAPVAEENLDRCRLAFEVLNLKICSRQPDQVWHPCYADRKNQAVINFNGDVYKCTARDFTEANRMGRLNDSGEIEWETEKIEQWAGRRLSKDVCRRCRIAPLCGGTCTQRIVESGDRTECIRGLKEKGKDQVVTDRFYYRFVKQA